MKVSLRLELIGIITVCFWKEKTISLEIRRQKKKGVPWTKRKQEKMDYRDQEGGGRKVEEGSGSQLFVDNRVIPAGPCRKILIMRTYRCPM